MWRDPDVSSWLLYKNFKIEKKTTVDKYTNKKMKNN